MTRMLFVLVTFSASLLAAESKAEADLRAQLAQTQAALAQAAKDRIAMQAQLVSAMAKLNAANADRAAAANLDRAAAGTKADVNALQAAQTADAARITAEAANTQAVISAVSAKVQADALIRVSDQSHTAALATLITSAFGFLTLIVGFAWKAYTDSRDHHWVMQSAEAAALSAASHRSLELNKIDAIAESAHAAYKEANDVNRKIENIGLRAADNLPLKPNPTS